MITGIKSCRDKYF